METLKNTTLTAREEHICALCGGIIAIGEKYDRQTNVNDGDVYDWVSHCDCSEVAVKIRMYNGCDDCGVNKDFFIEELCDYVYEKHCDETGDIAKDWQLPYHELAKKVLEELKEEKTK